MKTDPDAIIKKQQKDDCIEKLSDLISQKINNTTDLKKISDKIDFKKITDRINLKKIADKIDLKNNEKSEPSYKTDYEYYIKNPKILMSLTPKIRINKLNYKMLLIKLIRMNKLLNNIKNL